METITRHTLTGNVTGYIDYGVEVYKGIPYAVPPVSDLRWKPTRPVIPWPGDLDCTKYRANPMQFPQKPTEAYPEGFLPDADAGYSEDCLYLNIWTKHDDPYKNKPVIVYLFGGAFEAGSANTLFYEGDELVDKGVVVVTVNYRIGPFGFLCHPELRKEWGTSGNYGIMDQIMALQWIRDNIETFGGDGKNITLMGHSSGACCAEYIACSPHAKNLIQNVAVMSFLQVNRPIPNMIEKEEAITRDVGETSLADLRALSAEEVLEKFEPVDQWSPVVDGTYIPFTTLDAYRFGTANPCNMMIGSVAGDGPMGSKMASIETIQPSHNSKEFRAHVSRVFGLLMAPRMLMDYPYDTDEEWRQSNADLQRDELMALYYMTAMARAKHTEGDTYVYYDRVGLPGVKHLGAYHGSDIIYWFNNIEGALAETMSDQLVQFAKTGSPNRTALPQWDAFHGSIDFFEYPTPDPHDAGMTATHNDLFWQNFGEEEINLQS